MNITTLNINETSIQYLINNGSYNTQTILSICNTFDNQNYRIIVVLMLTWLFIVFLYLLNMIINNEKLGRIHESLDRIFMGLIGIPLCYIGFNTIYSIGYITIPIYKYIFWIMFIIILIVLYVSGKLEKFIYKVKLLFPDDKLSSGDKNGRKRKTEKN